MDINESSLNRYKTSKPITSRPASDTKTAAASTQLRGSTDASALKSPALKEGQIIRGQVIDHRYNEVRIQLEPSNQVVTAKLSGDVPLSIGQEANFQVTGNSPESLVLKYVPEGASQSSDILIQKALTASNLSMSENNKAIVQELLSHGMPIDTQTLTTLIKLSHTNQGVSPLTLVLMLKNKIPLTAENIRQFEAYQNGTHQLINDIRTIAGNLSKLITQPELLTSSTTVLSQPSPEALSTGTPINSSVVDDLALKNLTDPTSGSGMVNSENSIANLENSIANPKISSANNLLQPAATGQNPIPGTNTPAGTLVNSNNVIDKLIQISGKLLEELTINEVVTEQPNNEALPGQNPLQSQIQAESSIRNNTMLSGQLMSTNTTVPLSDLLNLQDRTGLLKLMNSFPDTSGIKEQIADGFVPLNKILGYIQENLPLSEKEVAGSLLGSKEYTKLLENAFLQKWTITPDKLAEKASMDDLYKNLQNDMEELSHLMKAGNNKAELLQLQEPVKNLQENLQFMKELNQAYTYIQLPVRLRDKQLHSDLYVFSRKKNLKEKADNISVLLHLDMDYLGPLNVHISLYNKSIQAKFYMADEQAEQLVTTNMPVLSQALSNRGYELNSEVLCNYKQPDFVHDFLEQDIGDGGIRRYTFDIRT